MINKITTEVIRFIALSIIELMFVLILINDVIFELLSYLLIKILYYLSIIKGWWSYYFSCVIFINLINYLNNTVMKTKILFAIVIAFLLAIMLGICTSCQKTNQRIAQSEEVSILGQWYIVGKKFSNDSITPVMRGLRYTFLDSSKYLSIFYSQQLNYNLITGNKIYMELTYNTPTECILTKDTLYLNNHITVDSSYWSVLVR